MNVRLHEATTHRAEHIPSADRLALEGDVTVVEFSLLLTVHQARALEAAARRAGLTVGQMARHALRDFLGREPRPSRQAVPRGG